MSRCILGGCLRGALVLAGAVWLGGCSWFYPGPAEGERERVEAHVKQDMSMDDARAEVEGLGYTCQHRAGSFYDDQGRERQASEFLVCTKRTGLISFYCTTRDQVVVVPQTGRVQSVYVVSGPSCINNARPD